MPILRNTADGRHILKGFVRAAHGFCTWQVSNEGIRVLNSGGIKIGDRLPHELFQQLIERGYAFTGKSGVVEVALTPASLEVAPHTFPSESITPEIDSDAEKLLERWLPRLADRSSDVRENASVALGKLTVRSPACRERLVILLLDFAVQEEYWHVILNGLLFKGEFATIPKLDAKWLDPFVEAYLELGAIPDAKQSGGWRELQELIEEGYLKPTNPIFRKVINAAKQALNGSDEDARKHIFTVIDWAEDNT